MRRFFSFRLSYFIVWICLLLIEIFIGACLHDAVIRPYGGDYLVVILLYTLLQSFVNIPVIPAAAGVLLFSYLVEFSQYFDMAGRLGFDHPCLMRVLLGSSFSWMDMLAYTLGIFTVLVIEKSKQSRKWNIS